MKNISIKTIVNPYTVITLAVFIFYGRLLFGDMLYTGDIFAYQLPEKFMIRESLMNGALPFINPYILSGSPMLNNIAVAALYPLNSLLLIGSPVFGFNLFIFAHLLLAGFTIYLFLSKGLGIKSKLSCLGGISYALSGPLWGSIDKGFIASSWLIPLFFMGVIKLFRKDEIRKGGQDCEIRNTKLYKSPLILPVVSLTLLFYCGNFMEAYFALLVAGVGILLYSLFWGQESTERKDSVPEDKKTTKCVIKRISIYCLVTVMAILIAAPQIFPTYLASKRSYREGGINLKEAQHWSLPPSRILEFFIPFAFGTRPETGFDFSPKKYEPLSKFKSEGSSPWFDSLFFGLPILCGGILAIFAILKCLIKKKKLDKQTGVAALLLSGALIFFLLAIGKSFPLYWFFYYILPGFRVFRHPEKFMEWVNLFLIIFGLYGLQHFCISKGKDGLIALRKIVYFTAFFLFVFMIITAVDLLSKSGVREDVYQWRLTMISLSILATGVTALTLSIFKDKAGAIVISLITITAIHLILISHMTKWTISQRVYETAKVWTDELPDLDKSQWRVFTSKTSDYSGKKFTTKDFRKKKMQEYINLNSNAPALKKVRTPEGFDAVAEKDYVDFLNLRKHPAKILMDIFSVKYIGTGLRMTSKTPGGFKRVKLKNELLYRGTMILENPDALPRISLYKKYLTAKDKDAVFKTKHDLKEFFILENGFPVKDKECGVDSKLKILEDSPGKITLEVTGGPSWVVIRDWHCPGWECRDELGNSLPIATVDGGVMGVFANSESQILKFRFIPPGFYAGLVAAGVGMVLLVLSAKFAKTKIET